MGAECGRTRRIRNERPCRNGAIGENGGVLPLDIQLANSTPRGAQRAAVLAGDRAAHVHQPRSPQAAVPRPPKPAATMSAAARSSRSRNATCSPRSACAKRIDKQTVTIDTGDGRSRRVPFELPRHVLDIGSSPASHRRRRQEGSEALLALDAPSAGEATWEDVTPPACSVRRDGSRGCAACECSPGNQVLRLTIASASFACGIGG
jgi:hypothetical protein